MRRLDRFADRHSSPRLSPRSIPRACATALAVAILASRLGAQSEPGAARSDAPKHADRVAEPARPTLAAAEDPRDAAAYVRDAWRSLARRDVKRALASAYWGTRLDPTSAPALMAYWQARWLSERALYERVLRGDAAAARSPEAARIDSLHLRALYRDPFAVVGAAPGCLAGRPAAILRNVLARDSSQVGAYVLLAGCFYAEQRYDSTVAYLRGALRALDRRTAADPARVYESREIFHFAIGRALYAAGDRVAARESFAAAAVEAYAFHPAHAALGAIAWTNWSDLETARREFDLALELRDDAAVRYDYGTVLLEARQPEAALVQFDSAAVMEPYFANVRFNRALALDRLGRGVEAALAYRAFLDVAPRGLRDAIAAAEARLQSLALEAGGPRNP